LSLGTANLTVSGLPTGEDLDALHFRPSGNVLFSTSTTLFIDAQAFRNWEIVEYDVATGNYSVFFDGSQVDPPSNVDAFSLLPNGNFLISTAVSGSLYGFDFLNGDVVEVDPVAETAALFMGLDEARLFSGANQAIDALHFDSESGNLLISVLIPGIGTVAGLEYTSTSTGPSDVIEIRLSGGVFGGLFLRGEGLFDGVTRQTDAIAVPEPGTLCGLVAGVLLLAVLPRSRTRR
jgi:hypothetical protein